MPSCHLPPRRLRSLPAASLPPFPPYSVGVHSASSPALSKNQILFKTKKSTCSKYAKPFVQTLFSKNNELSSHRFCLQSVCYQTCFVNFIRSFVVQPLMNPFTIEELYKFPETFSQLLCA